MGTIQGAGEVEVHREVLVRGRLAVWVLMSRSDSVVPSLASGGGSGRGLGGRGDSQGANGIEVRRGGIVRGVVGAGVLGLGRGVSGSPVADLVKEEAASEVWGWVLGLPGVV